MLAQTPKRERVLICVPAHDCKVGIPTFESVVRAVPALMGAGFTPNIQCCPGNAMVASARQVLAQHARAGGFDQMFFVDADVGFPADKMVRLCKLPEEVVGGIYPYRTDEHADKWPVRWAAKPGDPLCANEHGLLEVLGIPGGFMRLRMSAVEKVIAAHPELVVDNPQAPGGTCHAIFHHEIKDRRYGGEDYFFCDLWRALGGKVWIEPNITFSHLGMKEWHGNLMETLCAQTEATQVLEAAQ